MPPDHIKTEPLQKSAYELVGGPPSTKYVPYMAPPGVNNTGGMGLVAQVGSTTATGGSGQGFDPNSLAVYPHYIPHISSLSTSNYFPSAYPSYMTWNNPQKK